MSNFNEFINAINKWNIDEVKETYISEYINMTTEKGLPALNFACVFGNVEIVKFLLDKGWSIECETEKNKFRPVHYAIKYGNFDIFQELINQNCSLSTKTCFGQLPIDLARESINPKFIRLLEDMLKDGRSPNELAIKSNFTERTELFDENSLLIPSLDNYTRMDFIGRGGFGRVFKCVDNNSKKLFALKEIPFEPRAYQTEISALEKEIKMYNTLADHPRIVKYYGSIKNEFIFAIALEFMSAGSLHDKLKKYGPFVVKDISRYTKQILEGLEFLHDKEIIHRDIKVMNILINGNDDIKLGDFGISRQLEIISSQCSEKEKANSRWGTSYYMAPEVIREEKYDKSVDIWSLGATVIEMLTGKHPYPDLKEHAAMFYIETRMVLEYKSPIPVPDTLQSFFDQTIVGDPSARSTAKMLLQSPFITYYN